METAISDKPECPEIIKYPEMDYCKLSDKPCYLERGWECKIYKEFLEKITLHAKDAKDDFLDDEHGA